MLTTTLLGNTFLSENAWTCHDTKTKNKKRSVNLSIYIQNFLFPWLLLAARNLVSLHLKVQQYTSFSAGPHNSTLLSLQYLTTVHLFLCSTSQQYTSFSAVPHNSILSLQYLTTIHLFLCGTSQQYSFSAVPHNSTPLSLQYLTTVHLFICSTSQQYTYFSAVPHSSTPPSLKYLTAVHLLLCSTLLSRVVKDGRAFAPFHAFLSALQDSLQVFFRA